MEKEQGLTFIETPYEKFKRINIVILLPAMALFTLAIIVSGFIIDAKLGTKWADIIISIAAGIFIISLIIYLPIYLSKMKKGKIVYTQFYKSLSVDGFYTRIDGIRGKIQVDRKGLRGKFINLNWSDYDIKGEVFYINGIIRKMLIKFVAKDNSENDILLRATYKNFYIIKNHCGQGIENADDLEQYIEQAFWLGTP